MHSVAEAAIESGIRAVLTRSTMDQGAFTRHPGNRPRMNAFREQRLCTATIMVREMGDCRYGMRCGRL